MQVEVFSEKCKQVVKIPKIRRVKKEALTKEILVKLLRNLDAKSSTAVLVGTASGMRVGEIAGLKLSDIEFTPCPGRDGAIETTRSPGVEIHWLRQMPSLANRALIATPSP